MTAISARLESPTLRVPALLVAGTMVLGAVASVFAGVVVLPIGVGIACIGIPYTAVALVLWVLRRALITPLAPADEAADGAADGVTDAQSDRDALADQAAYDRKVQAFGLFSQRASLVLAVVLLGLLVLVGLGSIGTSLIVSSGPAFPVWVLAGSITAGAIVTIAVNMPQLYSGRIMALERHAVATRTGSWRWIVVGWIASPLMWVAYSAASAGLLLPSILR
ncbi:hypothetical protein [Herbiconiux solani]|uniref:hypothetical protein n=1 Tax=Herbiconiux solani TaxID=661329 RepID=UPI0008244311|nr:hypothetical protein [Herbiconiux solani]